MPKLLIADDHPLFRAALRGAAADAAPDVVTREAETLAGVLALALNTGGVLAKLFAEAVEAIDPGPVEGVRATGASALQEVIFGVIPQVLPLWISYSLYRFESNVRSATVVGMVGAGGIGVILWEAIRGFQFAQTCALLIVIILVVSADRKSVV